jgi:type II secretory pathway pseudopilin PulG
MKIHPNRRARPKSEEGYVLIAVIFMLLIFMLAISVAAPKVARSIQRDRELETMHRGKQYRRAVQLYYRKFNAYPPNVDALVKTQELKFLRKKYLDPITGQDDWKPVMFGQNKTPTAMGFFGQPIVGNPTTLAGVGPGGAGTGLTGSPGMGGTLGGANGSPGSNSLFGLTDASGGAGAQAGQSANGTGTDQSGATGGGPGASGNAANGAGGSASNILSGSTGGQTFGGVGIIGFSPGSPKQSLMVYKKKNHYNEWEFTYDPLQDRQTISGNTGMIGQPASSTTTPVGGTGFGSNGTGFGSSGSGFGSSGSGFGSSGSGFGSNSGSQQPTPTPAPNQ